MVALANKMETSVVCITFKNMKFYCSLFVIRFSNLAWWEEGNSGQPWTPSVEEGKTPTGKKENLAKNSLSHQLPYLKFCEFFCKSEIRVISVLLNFTIQTSHSYFNSNLIDN